jgi:hypothetical protein
MAFVVTDRANGAASGFSGADATTASFTPSANSVLLAFVHITGTGTVSGITGHASGGAWVKIQDAVSGALGAEVWASFPGASPSAGTVTISRSYMDQMSYMVYDITGANVSGSVASAFGVKGGIAGYDLRAETLALGAFASATNLTVAAGFVTPSGHSITFEGGYTAGTKREEAGNHGNQIAWKASEDTSVDVTFQNFSYNKYIAFEVKEAGGSSSVAPLAAYHLMQQ